MACPICNTDAAPPRPWRMPDERVGLRVDCDRCGSFVVTEQAIENLPGALQGDDDRIARLAFAIRRMQIGNRLPFLTTQLIDDLLRPALSSVFEQANNLIEWLGIHGKGAGETEWIEPRTHQFVVGAKTERGFGLLVRHLFDNDYLTGALSEAMGSPGRAHATLTFKGWEHFDRIQRGAVDSRKAFMAMQYGDADLDRVVAETFRPAVAQTGVSLVRPYDHPRAGLIDDRLRVEIRACRFMIADLTHSNAGAYWEAGYAEGLGKQVIYTCERGVFEREQTHFDTNHHLTVIWDVAALDQAAIRLKATIRATLPDVARLED